jgi:hypothetical protein
VNTVTSHLVSVNNGELTDHLSVLCTIASIAYLSFVDYSFNFLVCQCVVTVSEKVPSVNVSKILKLGLNPTHLEVDITPLDAEWI